MRRIVINRSVDTARLEQFRHWNRHLPTIDRVEAAEGQDISVSNLVERGIAEGGLVYSPGAIGAAMSHLGLWSMAVQQNTPLTIFEDDAMLCRNFESEQERLLRTLPDDWDVILWGYNFNAPITLDVLPGITRSVVTFEEKRMQKNADAFCGQDRNAVLFPLLQGFGLCAYSVSVQGAKNLLATCLPLRAQEYQQLGLDRMVRNVGIDVVTSHYFSRMRAFGALPPLALSKNDKTISTIKKVPMG